MRPLLPTILVLSLAASSDARAQEFDFRGAGIPRDVAARIDRILDDPRTTRLEGTSTIAAGAQTDGSVVVTDGSLSVAGTIRGDLIALRADVVLEAGAVVAGEITVIDGTLRGEDVARIAGTVTVYGEGFDLWERARRYHGDREYHDRDWWQDDRHEGAQLRLRVGENYNRVEGLPVQFGPDIRTGGPFGTRVQALAIWRTAVGPVTRTENMGYEARLEQFLGGDAFRVGAGVRSTIDPIESWNLSSLEATLAALLFHDDQRDYYERTGWNVYARIAPRRSALDLTLEYRDEEHRSVAARDPWTLFNGDHAWRSQPLIGEGDLRTLSGTIEWDERRGPELYRRGWYARAQLTRALESRLAVPSGLTLTEDVVESVEYSAPFTTGLLDVRRYARSGPGGMLGMRVVAGGALSSSAVPPQFQHALGGAGTLPGFALFAQDCGARRARIVQTHTTAPGFFAGYGCDRFALAQFEYRGGFDFRIGHDDHDRRGEYDHWQVNTGFDWTVFFDAAHGWALEQDRLPGRSDTGMLYDVGAGVVVGGLGIYGAVPLNRQDRGLRLSVRLGPRF